MIKFRRKNFSLRDNILSGASKGGLVGLIYSSLSNHQIISKKLGIDTSKSGQLHRGIAFSVAGSIIGAGLGVLAHLIFSSEKKVNQGMTVNKRRLPEVIDTLKDSGFKEGRDFTRDPKIASERKMKVCLVISKVSDDLKILVNTESDPKLKTISDGMVKNLPRRSTVTRNMSDKFNDIMISTISDKSKDIGMISGMVEYYIRHGFPVYIVEVG